MSGEIIVLMIYLIGIFVTWIINDTLIQLNHKYKCTDEFGIVLIVVFWPFVLVCIKMTILFYMFKAIINWISKNIAIIIQNIVRKK